MYLPQGKPCCTIHWREERLFVWLALIILFMIPMSYRGNLKTLSSGLFNVISKSVNSVRSLEKHERVHS